MRPAAPTAARATSARSKRIVSTGEEPGLLATSAANPRAGRGRAARGDGGLARSRTLQPIDDLPVWSVTCFYVAKAHRKQGVTVALLEAAAKYVKRRRASRSRATRTTRSSLARRVRLPWHGERVHEGGLRRGEARRQGRRSCDGR
jgi:GNAT superfamily N-acetyltransferase